MAYTDYRKQVTSLYDLVQVDGVEYSVIIRFWRTAVILVSRMPTSGDIADGLIQGLLLTTLFLSDVIPHWSTNRASARSRCVRQTRYAHFSALCRTTSARPLTATIPYQRACN